MSKANKTKQSNFFYDFIFAGISAAFSKTAMAPLERVKLLLQNQHAIHKIEDKYKGISDCFSKLIKKEGVPSLWRGNVANVIRYFPNQAFNFAFKDTFKTIFCKYDPNKNFVKFALANCLSGGLAASISLFVVHPIDLARTRLATDNRDKHGSRQFNGSIDCVKQLYRNEGIRGIYKGIAVSVVGIFAYRAAFFGGYDTLKGSLIKADSGLAFRWMMAQIITVISGTCFYPLDTVRRRIMLQSGQAVKQYDNAIDCIRKMYRQESFIGFYKGFGTNILRTSGGSMVLVLYDELQKLFGLEARGGIKE
jgi:solute carrier family 25 (adenine nucleotide translocator) protein 4/5/6/31